MSGIATILSLSPPPDCEDVIRRMLAAMSRLGAVVEIEKRNLPAEAPGISAVAHGFLGHIRRTGRDVSGTVQPMFKGQVCITYNGECHNLKEERAFLEKRGHSFISELDTEVLLTMYLEYGEEFVQRLHGSFAFVLYDARSGTALCARDPLGIKALLYSSLGNNFIAGSNLRCLLASGMLEKKVDRQSLYFLLRNGSVPQPRTILENVHALMPGHILKWCNGSVTLRPYWQMKTNRLDLRGFSYPELLEAGQEQITQALRLNLPSNTSWGAFLSGGIDSSLLVALMQQAHGKIKTFSIGFAADLKTATQDETTDAELVAAHLGCDHKSVIIEQGEIFNLLRRIARDLDHPTVDGVNSWFVSRAGASELNIAISGTGGDELFCGYPWFGPMYKEYKDYSAWNRRFKHFLGRDDFVKKYKEHFFICSPALASSLLMNCEHQDAPVWDPLPFADPLDRVTGLTLGGYTLNQLLFDMDTAAAAHSLDVRVPLLDVKLLDFALSLPPEAKLGISDSSAPHGSYAHSGVKRLLLDLGKDLLPVNFSRRGKRGFILPFDAWLHNELSEVCENLLSPEIVNRRGFFNAGVVSEIWRSFKNGQQHWSCPWLLMMIEIWAEEVLDA